MWWCLYLKPWVTWLLLLFTLLWLSKSSQGKLCLGIVGNCWNTLVNHPLIARLHLSCYFGVNVIWEACCLFLVSVVTWRWKYVTLACWPTGKRHITVISKKEENASSSTLNSKDLQDLLGKQSWSGFSSLTS